jgi:hypothetical protein
VLKSIDKSYQVAHLAIKQKIICSIFLGKLIFENNKFRTNRINSVVELITHKNSKLFGHKKGLNEKSIIQSSGGYWIIIEPIYPGFTDFKQFKVLNNKIIDY